MFKFVWLLLFVALPLYSQTLTGRRGNPAARTFNISAQILDQGSFQLQRSGPGLTNWTGIADFNASPGTNGFSDSITNAHRFYRVVRFTEAPVITNQPVGLTNFYNQEVRLEVSATGSWPLNYYWYRDGVLLENSTSNVLVFAGHTNFNGTYRVGVSNTWGIVLSTPVSVKTIHPVATSIMGKKIQYVIKGQQGGFIGSGSFETTYGSLNYQTTSANFNLNDSGQWQYGALNPNIGRAIWTQGFVYPNGAFVDMTFTNLSEGTFNLQLPNINGRQFGEFKIAN